MLYDQMNGRNTVWLSDSSVLAFAVFTYIASLVFFLLPLESVAGHYYSHIQLHTFSLLDSARIALHDS